MQMRLHNRPQNGAFTNIDSRTDFRTKLTPNPRRFREFLICPKNVRFLNSTTAYKHTTFFFFPLLFPLRSIIYYIIDTIWKEVNYCVRKNRDKNRYTCPVCSSGRSQDHFRWNAYQLFWKQSGVIQEQKSNMELPNNGSSYRSDRTLS